MFLTNKFLRKKAFLEGGVFKRMSKSVLRNRRDGSDIFDTTNRIINFANPELDSYTAYVTLQKPLFKPTARVNNCMKQFFYAIPKIGIINSPLSSS